MRNRQKPGTPAVSFLFLAVLAAFAGWTGCGAAGTAHISGGTTSSTSSGTGGAGGSAFDAGNDAEAGPSCTSTQKVCNDTCVDQGDPAYGCSPTFCTSCPTYANATPACSMGACTIGSCATGFKNCDNSTTGCNFNVSSDPMNCGACGSACPVNNNTPACTNSVCTVGTCATGFTDCNGVAADGCEANTQEDQNNCGTCGNVCPMNNACQAGQCVPACPKGFCSPASMPNSCNTMTGTNKNCNFCGDVCNLANSTSNCVPDPSGNGNDCTLVGCNTGFANCDQMSANGCEVNTTNDANNCNSCGNQCPFGPNSTAICSNSVCELSCNTGFSNCGQPPIQGCPVNTGGTPGDVLNCGGCGMACSTNHATEACNAGTCSIVSCQAGGWTDCNNNPADGCEANLQNDVNNCGTCHNICTTANGTPTCNQGKCGIASCNTGFAHCATSGTDCETNTATNVNNCGTCGYTCSTVNGTPSCSGGACSIACTTGFANCSGNVANGCQTPLGTVTNCNGCAAQGGSCTTINGTAGCTLSGGMYACVATSCATGYANCPGDGTNCSTYIKGSDTQNCGGCGMTCPTGGNVATAVCTNGLCTPQCVAGFMSCNGDDTCSTNTGSDVDNCGSCGNVCPGAANNTATCTNGVCGCVSGTTLCNGACIDVNGSDDNNCGACGATCDVATCGGAADHVAATQCTSGHCEVASCLGNYEDVDNACSDGCECLPSAITTCGTGATQLGTVQAGGAAPAAITSNLYPATNGANYYQVTFTESGTLGSSYAPTIKLTNNTAFAWVMDVTSNCSGSDAEPISSVGSDAANVCNQSGDASNSSRLTSWSVFYGPPNEPAADPTSHSPSGASNFTPIPLVGSSGTVYIKVYPKSGTPSCLDTYTLTVTNP